jgi:hypothetical protein
MGEWLADLGEGSRPARSSGGSASTGPLPGGTGNPPVGSGVVTGLVAVRDVELGSR